MNGPRVTANEKFRLEWDDNKDIVTIWPVSLQSYPGVTYFSLRTGEAFDLRDLLIHLLALPSRIIE